MSIESTIPAPFCDALLISLTAGPVNGPLRGGGALSRLCPPESSGSLGGRVIAPAAREVSGTAVRRRTGLWAGDPPPISWEGGRAINRKRTNSGRQVIAAAGATGSVLIGLLTNMVFGVRGTGLAVTITALALLTALSAVLASRDIGPDRPAGEDPAELPAHGDAYGSGTSKITGVEAEAMATSVSSVAAAVIRPPLYGAGAAQPVDRAAEREKLKTDLDSGRSGVILVHGRPGAGKTTLVNAVLREIDPSRRPQRHEIVSGYPLDAKTLLDDIAPGPALRLGEDVLSRLQVAMEASDGAPLFIVIDGAQALLDPDTHTVINLELAEALKIISDRRPRQVKVILVVREPPAPEADGGWLTRAEYIQVSGLGLKHFNEFIHNVDPTDQFGLTSLVDAEPSTLHNAVQGNPGLAIAFRAVLALSRGERSAVGLARSLADSPAEEGERLLVGKLVERLTTDQRSVVVGFAAFGTPIYLEQLEQLVISEQMPAGRVSVVLEELVDSHVVGMARDGRYQLSAPANLEALTPLLDVPQRLRLRAATLLEKSRVPDDQIHRLEDLHVHFAELDIRVNGKLWGSAYELIEHTEDLLERWNAEVLLLKYRMTVADHLPTKFLEMANCDALGYLYRSRGRFDDAIRSFEMALGYAKDTTSSLGRRRIYLNLGALHWDRGNTKEAERYYRDGLASAEEDADALDRMTAMAGLADCYRRWGEYSAAIDHGMAALSIARSETSPWAVGIAVKLARWRSELDEQAEADRLLDVAREAAVEHPGAPQLRVRHLDAIAGLLLDRGELEQANEAAERALAEALQLHDPVTVLQARTTMATVNLRLDNLPEARREIERAGRYRRKGRSLVVLALQALIEFRGNPGRAKSDELFTALRREAVERRRYDERDFAAWEFEGLAICGTQVGRGEQPLDAAIDAFRRAREQAPPTPVLDARLRLWFEILQAGASLGQLTPVLNAAIGTKV